MYTSTCSFTGKRTVVVSGHITFRIVCLRSGFAFRRLLFTVLCDLVVSSCFRALNTLVLLFTELVSSQVITGVIVSVTVVIHVATTTTTITTTTTSTTTIAIGRVHLTRLTLTLYLTLGMNMVLANALL